MMIHEKYLKTAAGNTPSIGELMRHNHDECGDKRGRLYVKRTEKGYLYHCHNCAPQCSGFVNKKVALTNEELKEKIINPMSGMVSPQNHYEFPPDFEDLLPIEWCRWLAQFDIFPEDAAEYGIGWSPSSGNLIMPVFNNEGEVHAWTERLQSHRQKNGVKYLLRTPDMGSMEDHLYIDDDPWPYLVLVEDYLSTIKVGKAANAFCLNGSFLPRYLIPELRRYDRVFVWLDYDKRDACINMATRLNNLGIKAVPISTKKDPKALSLDRINRLLEKRMNV